MARSAKRQKPQKPQKPSVSNGVFSTLFLSRRKRNASRQVSPARTPVRRRPSLDFSISGLVFCSMMMFMGLAAVNSQTNLLFGVFGLMGGVVVVSMTIGRLVLRRLSIARNFPEQVVAGQPATITYEFTNDKRYWPSLSVGLNELDGTEAFAVQPFAYMLHAAHRQTATVDVRLTPKRRGLHALNQYQLYTSFPFGFVKRAVTREQPDTILVCPPTGRVSPRLMALLRSADNTGASVRPREGGDDEFYGVRDYQPGDSPRRVYWRRSARTGVLVTKEMTQVAPPRLLLLVDTLLHDRTIESHAAIERCIARAASLAVLALEQDLMVGCFAWNNGWDGLAPARGKRQLRDVLAMLAQLPMNTAHQPADMIEAANQIRRDGTTCVLFGPRQGDVPYHEMARGTMLAVPDGSGQADAWFQFENIDFANVVPVDQDPRLEDKKSRFRIRS